MILKPRLFRKPRKGHWATKGLVCYLLMNEGTGEKTFDLSGNGNTGTVMGSGLWKPGKFGTTLYYDGTDDYVALTDGKLTPLSKWSLSLWVKKGPSAAGGSIYQEYNSKIKLDLTYGFHTHTFLATRDYDTTDAIAESSELYVDGYYVDWTHVVVTFDAPNLKIYLNGKDDTVASTAGVGSMVGKGADLNRIHFGNTYFYGNDWLGFIDVPSFYNRALCASEIARLYRKPFCMFERDPIELWSAATLGAAPPAGIPIFRRRREAC